jgi:hypothetical protein
MRVYTHDYRFLAFPICAPTTFPPNSKLLRLSCQCAAKGLRCNNIKVRELFPLAVVPPSDDWRRYVNYLVKVSKHTHNDKQSTKQTNSTLLNGDDG